MASHNKRSNTAAATQAKKHKASTSDVASNVSDANNMAMVLPHVNDHSMEDANPASSLIPKSFERLALTINPDFHSAMAARRVVGYQRPFASRNMTNRFYTINLDCFRDSIHDVFADYLTMKLFRTNKWTAANIAAEVEYVAPLVRDACCTALYARLRPVHRSLAEYTLRFHTPSQYAKDLELPLPFADAIQNFGPFNPVGTVSNYYCVPVYPENTQNEGRASPQWRAARYEDIIPRLKDLGIPFKSVDTRIKNGTSWWCYRLKKFQDALDLTCLYPPINYSDHSAIVASMFIRTNADNTEAVNLTQEVHGDTEYPVRFRDLPSDYGLRAFSALCQDPREVWNEYQLM